MAGKGASYADLIAKAKTYAIDWKELLKPFGGSIAAAVADESYNFEFGKAGVAQRLIHLTEADGMTYLRQGREHWVKLTKL
jgi:hypothetical protein